MLRALSWFREERDQAARLDEIMRILGPAKK